MASYAQLLDSKGQPLPRSPAALPGVGRYRFPGCRGFHGHVGERPVAGNVSDGRRDSRSLQALYVFGGSEKWRDFEPPWKLVISVRSAVKGRWHRQRP